jgi:phosphatidylserine/phosphatidylglycerophosphate/cardiolipin synthase-like enzyme
VTEARFAHFAAIDWSGAAGERQRGIAVALCPAGDTAPRLIRPDHVWSRAEVLDWLRHELPADTMVGMDLGQSLPFADAGSFFPDWVESPRNARSLWAMVEAICAAEPHLGVTSFVTHPQLARYFRQRGAEGTHFQLPDTSHRQGRFRVTEIAQARVAGCRPTSNFNLVGAAQVGKSSLSGMRLLHRLNHALPVWPIDPLPRAGSVVAEIYTAIAALAGGRPPGRSKIRDHAALDAALTHPEIASRPVCATGPISDHAADALLTAAWLRRAATHPALWRPAGLDAVAHTEGWTFGAV